MSQAIEDCIAHEQWEAARRLIEEALTDMPESHWLLTRLGLTYYEQFDYRKALEIAEKALAIAPDCPLVLWDYAGSLEMLDRPQEAIAVYQKLIERGVEALAYDECGEGRAWARGLYADCFYRMSHCCLALGRKAEALDVLSRHLNQRGPGCRSIYPIRKVRAEMAALKSVPT